MNSKAVFSAVLIFAFAAGLVFTPGLAAQDQEEQQQPRIIIPEQVKTVMQQGLATRQARVDIPFSVIKHLYLPAQTNMHNIFFFNVKAADLGFAALTPPGEEPEKKEEQQEESSFETTPARLKATSHLFLSFQQQDGEFEKDVYIPIPFEADGAGFQPEQEMTCSFGYPLPMGKYLLAISIASKDLQRIGVQYFEFSTPVAQDMENEMLTTPVFFVKNLTQMASPETTTELHQDYFTYSVLQVTPNLEKIFKAGENLDILFFVFGAQPNESQQYDLGVSYEVLKDDIVEIKYADTKYQSPLVSQPLPLTKTIVSTTTMESGETKEKKETKDLPPGMYTLKITISDAVSNKTTVKTVEFEMK